MYIPREGTLPRDSQRFFPDILGDSQRFPDIFKGSRQRFPEMPGDS
jgi:hypothetical protein